MAKTKVLTDQQWIEIKNEFMLGKSANAIAKQFGVTHRTILLHAKKSSWDHGVLSSEIADITRSVASVINKIDNNQIPGIEAKLGDIFTLQEKVNNYIYKAIDLNIINLDEVSSIQDINMRVDLTAKMKANMVDLANISNKNIAEKHDSNNITSYDIDTNPIEAYMKLIKG